MDSLHLVPVVTGLSDFEAKLLSAQLGAEGILWQTRGIVDSIYPFGGIDVLVPAAQVDDARLVLLTLRDRDPVEEFAPDAVPDRPAADGAAVMGRTRLSWWVGLAAVSAVVSFVVVRVVAVL